MSCGLAPVRKSTIRSGRAGVVPAGRREPARERKRAPPEIDCSALRSRSVFADKSWWVWVALAAS